MALEIKEFEGSKPKVLNSKKKTVTTPKKEIKKEGK
jgi:hypothetical protein